MHNVAISTNHAVESMLHIECRAANTLVGQVGQVPSVSNTNRVYEVSFIQRCIMIIRRTRCYQLEAPFSQAIVVHDCMLDDARSNNLL